MSMTKGDRNGPTGSMMLTCSTTTKLIGQNSKKKLLQRKRWIKDRLCFRWRLWEKDSRETEDKTNPSPTTSPRKQKLPTISRISRQPLKSHN
jgi:hypothetical protein